MKHAKKKKMKEELELEDDANDTRPVRFEALAELTNSEVIEQVKSGLSRIAPIEMDEDNEENAASY